MDMIKVGKSDRGAMGLAKPFLRGMALAAGAALLAAGSAIAQPKFKVLIFDPVSGDLGHDSYMKEAKTYFPKLAQQYGFQADFTENWNDCNASKLAQYKVVMFLDNRPEQQAQRDAFKAYMDNGGGWIGCHFAAFAMNASGVKQNWDWYHKTFLGSEEYRSNTWAPTPAFLKVEDTTSVYTKGLPTLFKASANEWYRWTTDWKAHTDIRILASIDPSSYPLGTGPKPEEIWHEGYYPVVWTNVKYKMLYLNMGHNDIDYANGNKDKSQTLTNETQNKLITNAILEFGGITTKTYAIHPQARSQGLRLIYDGNRLTAIGAEEGASRFSVTDVTGRAIMGGNMTGGRNAADKEIGKGFYFLRAEAKAAR
jgi:hypothetical protein